MILLQGCYCLKKRVMNYFTHSDFTPELILTFSRKDGRNPSIIFSQIQRKTKVYTDFRLNRLKIKVNSDQLEPIRTKF
jgi:hypothetical protein